MPLTHDQLADFTKATISNFKQAKWTDISLPLVEYVATDFIDKAAVEKGGDLIKFDVQTSNLGLARNTGLYAQDVTGVGDVLVQGQIPWTKQTVNYSYDIDEDEFQSERETIVRLLMLREHVAMNDLAELNEVNLWSGPSSSSDQRPMGVPHWIVKDATTTVGGAFNGGNPSGWTAGAGNISSTTYPRWKNWTFGYTNPTVDDLVAKVKKSLFFTNFKAPHPHPELGYGKSQYSMFTTYRVIEPLERQCETRNDNLGSDLAKYIGQVTIAGVPMKAVHYLENADTSDPVYGINWKAFKPFTKSGRYMVRSKPKQSPTQHTVFTVHIDSWMNYGCLNRRLLWVGSK
jgi:hypothetical protein